MRPTQTEKICFFTPPYPRVKTWFDMVDVAAEYGHTALEGFNVLDLKVPDKALARRIREYADSRQIRFCCLSVGIHLVGEHSREHIQMLKDYADIAAILGAPYLHHTVAVTLKDRDRLLAQRDELFRRGIDAVREVYDYAQSIGIRTVIEDQGYIFNGVESFRRFLDCVDRDIGLLADFGNIYQCGDSLPDFIRAFAGRFVHAHIKDITLTDTNVFGNGILTTDGQYMNQVPIGRGIVPLKEGLALLKESGFDGWCSIEYSAAEDDTDEIDGALQLLRSLTGSCQ